MNSITNKELKKEYFERTIHDAQFDTEQGRWSWISQKLTQEYERGRKDGYCEGFGDYCDDEPKKPWGAKSNKSTE